MMLEYFDLLVEDFNNRGQSEEELYKNYSKKVSRFTIARCLMQNFLSVRMIEKNNRKAKEYYTLAKAAYDNLEYSKSIKFFTKSLSYAIYYSQDFIRALVGRLMASYIVRDYKSCIQDKKWLLSSTLETNLERRINLIVENCLEKSAPSTETVVTPDANSNIQVVNEVVLPDCHSLNFESETSQVTTQKPIKMGDTVFVTKPYSWAPTFCDDIAVDSFCQNCCLKTEILLPCKTCVEIAYCSERCQEEAWANFHQWECFGIRANFFKLSEFQLPVLRIIFQGLKVNFETDSLFDIPTRFQMRDNLQLIEAASVALITVAYLKDKSNFFGTLKSVPKFVSLTEEEMGNKLGGMFIQHYLQLLSHMISVKTVVGQFPTVVTYATAICPLFSKFKHSCKPNTSVYFAGGLIHVRAVKDIAENQDIFVSHRNVSTLETDLEKRRKMIRKYMGFSCKCSACTYFKINELYVCSKCQEGSALPDDENKTCLCLNCDHVFQISANYKENTIAIRKDLELYEVLGNVEFLKSSLTIGTKIFGFKNIFLLSIYDKLIRHYMDTDNHVEFLKMVKESYNSREALYGNISLKFGLDLCSHAAHTLQFVQKMKTDGQMERYKDMVECTIDFIGKLKLIFEIIHQPFLKTIEEMEKTAEELQFFCLSAYLLKTS